MPEHVVRRARGYLATLESQQLEATQSPQAQLPLGPANEEEGDELRDALDALDPDSMTPLQALNELYRLKKL